MKKDFLFLKKSRWLLFMLFALIVGGVSPAWAQKALPYSYGFEDGSPLGDGWTSVNASGGNSSYFGVYTDAKYSGTYGFRLSSWSAAVSEDNAQYLISPLLETSTSGIDVSFYYKNSGYSAETYKVGYSTTSADVSSFTFGDEQSASGQTWKQFTKSYGSDVKYIAIKYYASSSLYHLYIDDVLIKKTPTCITPTGLAASSINATDATLSWTAAEGQENWVLQYSTDNTFASDVTSVNVSSSSTKSITSLTACTTYYARVKADCGGGDESEWTDAISFTTPQEAVSANSFSDDFEGTTNWLFVNGTQTNAWVIGSATNNGGSKALYISNDGGTTNAYSTGSATMVYATKLFTFAAGKYDISYDWKGYGEGNYDYLRAAIVPASTTLTAGTTVLSGLSSTSLPSGWIAIDGGSQRYNSSSWQTQTAEATIETAGDYMVVFAWRNDGSSGTQPAAAIDNFSIDFQACPKPTGVAISDVKATEATLGWDNVDDTTWEVYVSTESAKPAADVTVTGTANTNTYQFTSLTAETAYYAWVRAVKGSDKSAWTGGVSFTTTSAGAVLTVSSDPIAFGLVSSGSNNIVIKNEGAAKMTGVTVTYTATTGDAAAITIGTVPTTVDGNSQQTVTVSVNTAKTGAFSGTITVAATDQTSVEIPVSGYVLDGTKICETFASLPDHWSKTGTWSFNATTGASTSNYNTGTMTSPKIVVSENETLTISAKSANAGESYYLKIEGSSDNGSTFNAYTKTLSTASDPALSTTDFVIVTLSDIPTTVNRLRITSYFSSINALNGFTYDEDPQLALYSDEACTTTQAATAEKNWGFVTAAQQQKYYIKNTGNGQIDLTIEQADGFTAAVDDAALTEGEKATLTIDMAATEGLHNGTVTVTAKNNKTSEVLGTFAVTLNGAVAGSKNDINFASLSELPAGWEKDENNKWTVTANSYVGNTSSAADLTSQTFTATAGETMLVEAKGNNTWQTPTLSYSYKVGDADWTTATAFEGLSTSDWKVFAFTVATAGDVKVKFNGAYVNIRRIYGFEAASVPVMVFTAADKNFGMVTTATTSDAYTITNSGAGVLNGLSVTCDNTNFEIAVADNATSIAANGGTATFTVKLKNDVKGLHEGTVTIAGTDVDSKTFAVKGYVADDTKIFTTFASLPDRWTNTGNYWSFSAANGAYATSSSSKLETPKIKVEEGQKLAISAKQQYSGSSYYVTINGSSDNGATWTAYTKTLNNTQLNNTDYTVVELDDVPAEVNKLQLVGYYVYVNGLNGFTYDDNDPQFAMYSNEACTTAISGTTATNAWGFVDEDKTATYYVKNTGTGTMNISLGEVPAGFSAALGAASLGTGESTTLTISMANDADTNEGYHTGDVVLTAKDNAENTLGTFTVTSSGVVVGSKTDVNFTTLDAFPAGWEATSWSVSSGKATISYTSGDLKTGTYTVAAGESMILEARRNSSSSYATIALTYSYSTDGGSTWSSAKTITPSSTNYELIAISDIPAGDAIVKFTGTYIDIQRIYGYTAVAKAAMTLLPDATSYDFGMQTAAADYEITVTNSGTAAMTNMTATLSGTDVADFEVALSVPEGSTATITDGKANIPVGQAIKVTATLKASTEYKEHSATLTISADDIAGKAITLSGKTRDASKLFVDFDNVSLPTTWDNEGWTVYNYGSDYYLYNSSYTTAYAVTTQALTVTEGESISFDVRAYSTYGSPYLTVRYSYNGGISWTDFATYAYDDGTLTTSLATKTISNLNAGTVVLQFVGTYCGIDNIIGFAPKADEPTISVKKSSTAVNNGDTEAFGSIKAEAEATYTIKNIGQGTLTITSPVTTTGDATAAVSGTSLANGESATLTITMPVKAPYGAKEGAVTVKTNLGDFVINYTANVLNPNALDEQFASGKPAGWYFGGYWEVSSQCAENTASGVADLITEQLTVAGTSDVLTFQAAKTGSSAETFKVYTSQDRVTWNEVDLSSLTLTTSYQDVNISGLAAGDYYVKISGARVKVDNFLGWTKKNNTRDLYVTATSIPTTLSANYTATATVTSLITAETGVYAKLFFGETVVATATAADVALNGTTTFTMSTESAPTTEDLYKAKVVVYYSDNTVAFTTGITNVGTLGLDEASAFTAEAGTYGSATLNRSFKAGWNSVCLPFAVSSVTSFFGDDASAYAFTAYSEGVLTFEKATSLEAGKSYLVYVETAFDTKALTNVEITATEPVDVTKTVAFKGTYAYIAAGGLDGKYVVSNSDAKIMKGTASTTMKGFRAYFENPTDARLSIVLNDDVQGIQTIMAAEEIAPEGVYNLKGQKVEQLKKGGLYIINGKKQVVK